MPGSMPPRRVATILALVGTVLLVAALFVPWYFYTVTANGNGFNPTVTTLSYLGLPSWNGTQRTVCNVPCRSSWSYSDGSLNATGLLAETEYFAVISSAAIGAIAAALLLRPGWRFSRSSTVCPAIASAVAVAAATLFAVDFPIASSSDLPPPGIHRPPGNGPWSSFFGSWTSCPGPGCGTFSWGPGIGWYLTLAAATCLVATTALVLRAYRRPSGTEASSVPIGPSDPAHPV